MNHSTSRREFLRHSSSTAAVLVSAHALGGVQAFGAERPAKVSLGIIGCGSIMGTHVRRLAPMSGEVSLAWLCDVDPQQIEKTMQLLSRSRGATPKTTAHFEEVLADKNVDACVIATPNHWHVPIALAAMQAGKDVYIEKPMSHTFEEGQKIIAAAKKYDRVVQHGTQMRSSPVTEKARQLLKEGILGEIRMARAWTAESRPIVSPVPDGTAPAGVDYDRWLGPAPAHAFNPRRFHKTWRLFRDYSNGDIGDDGVHDLDLASWALGVSTHPQCITARGSKMLAGHASEFPDTMNVTFEFPEGRSIVYESYSTMPYGIYHSDNGNVFYGTEGYMVFSRRGFFNVYLGPKATPGPTEGKELRGQRGYIEHMNDFLNAVRKRTTTCTPAEVAHRSSALAHLANIAIQTQGQLTFNPATEEFLNCNEANLLLAKAYRRNQRGRSSI
ncbi:MAG: Gfo/Idh/MocA family oxidoreductase [Pirellulales bacterium]|nr:Gfo/Idh/MocA family oxidoreductase [Pirellulales bacterium]